MGKPNSEEAVMSNYDAIFDFLLEGKYPESLVGDRGQKANFKRTCLQYAVLDGVLHYRHHKYRNDKQGQ